VHRAGARGRGLVGTRARSRRRRTSVAGRRTAPSGPAIAAAPREHLLWPRPPRLTAALSDQDAARRRACIAEQAACARL